MRYTADQDAPCERSDRRIAIRCEEKRSPDDRKIEQNRRKGGDRKAPIDVEDAAGERDERDEQDVRKHDPDHLRREVDLARRVLEPRGQQIDEPRCGEYADGRYHEQRDCEQRTDAPDERLRLRFAALPAVLGEDRHERLRKRAFGKKASQDVRQPECCLERIHLEAGAERRRFQAFADEPRHPGQQRQSAGPGRPDVAGGAEGSRQWRAERWANMRRVGFRRASVCCMKRGKLLLCLVFFLCAF